MKTTTCVHSEVDTAMMPKSVQRAVEFFRRRKLWYKLARNSAVSSCREAAARRCRLGKQGIPLYDELRSYCGVTEFADSPTRIVLCHCRANAHFDLDAVARLLGTSKGITRLPASELMERQVDYGTVNPFSETEDYVQVFDEDLLTNYTPPYTMMTNAGERTWGIEFNAAEVIETLRREKGRVLMGRITASSDEKRSLPVFGIITGNGPESGMALWRTLNDEVHARCAGKSGFCGDLSYPAVMVQSIPEMGLAVELPRREERIWQALSGAIERLRACGATHLALACHTAHYFADRIHESLAGTGVEFVSLVDVLTDYLQGDTHPEDMTIIGVAAVASLGLHSSYCGLATLGIHPLEDDAAPYMEEIARLVKHTDSHSRNDSALNRLQYVLRSRVHTSQVLVALTEVSVLLERYPKLRDRIGGKTIVDPLRLYGRALAHLYLRALPNGPSLLDPNERGSLAGRTGI